MKFVLVNGSPRRNGNTQFALNLLLRGIQQHFPQYHAELIHVTDFSIGGCMHCDACRSSGYRCVLKDDGNHFADIISGADIVIFATPVYWWGICGQLKTAIDRLYSKGDTLKGGKQIGIISVGADPLDNPQYDLIYRQFVCICEHMNWNLHYVRPIQAHHPDDLRKDAALCEILENDWKRFASLASSQDLTEPGNE